MRIVEIMHSNFNVASRLTEQAKLRPDQIAVATGLGRYVSGKERTYKTTSFSDFDQRTTAIAAGLQTMGMRPGHRIALLVRFGEDFIALVFALLKAGVTVVLVDPGMGRKNLVNCLAATNPDGFIAIPPAHLVRIVLQHRFPSARLNVTVGNRFGFLPSPSLDQLERTRASDFHMPTVSLDDAAAIIFTTGSTGPPKGVLYTHRTFNNQVDQLVEHYSIAPGGRDLSAFPLFGLFNAVMGVTTIIPDMDPTRPADVDPPRLLDAIDQWQVNQSFGSPALWTRVGRYCQDVGRRVPSLKRVFSAGAPVAPRVLEWVRAMMAPDGEVFTPYGATEALPVASIESRQVLAETAQLHAQGKGICVGKRFSGIEWRVINIDDGPLESIDQVSELGRGQIGELMVRGPVVSRQYFTRTDQNASHKVQDGESVWHRMGDVGYLDDQDRFWFCGRKSHRVQTQHGDAFTEPCEAIINTHPSIYRSALVSNGESLNVRPVMVVEPWPEHRPKNDDEKQLIDELKQLAQRHDVTRAIQDFLIYPTRLPTDIRHNAKIFREKLVPWVKTKIR
jgi:olefin beta-lactone synthetase